MRNLIVFLIIILATLHSYSQNNALYLGGTNDRVEIGNLGSVNNWTVEMWVLFDRPKNYEGLFHTHNSGGNSGVRVETSTNSNLGHLVLAIQGSNYTLIPTSTPLPTTWTHLAFVSDKINNKGYFYMDGVKIFDGSISNLPSTIPDFVLGRGFGGAAHRHFQGTFDDVRIWDVARSEIEIQNNMNAALGGNEPGLLALYTFDQGIAGGNNTGTTTLLDSSPNGHNGLLQGFALSGNISNWVSSGIALPVELISFNSESTVEGSCILTWHTASETNNKGFEIERSKDGQQWETLEFINGKGTTSEKQSYEYMDYSPEKGVNYYRLNQIDFDGKSKHSEIVAVSIGTESLVQNFYPNPVHNFIHFPNHESGTFILTDVMGREVARINFDGSSADVSMLAQGMYYGSLSDASPMEPMVIVKE